MTRTLSERHSDAIVRAYYTLNEFLFDQDRSVRKEALNTLCQWSQLTDYERRAAQRLLTEDEARRRG